MVHLPARPRLDRIDEGILQRYTTLYDAFFADRPRFQTRSIARSVLRISKAIQLLRWLASTINLRLPGSDKFSPKLQSYVESLAGYRKNEYARRSMKQLAASCAKVGKEFRHVELRKVKA